MISVSVKGTIGICTKGGGTIWLRLWIFRLSIDVVDFFALLGPIRPGVIGVFGVLEGAKVTDRFVYMMLVLHPIS